MRINQNIAAFNAYRNLSNTQGSQAKSLEKLSSGFRINRAADDASGLVNSENLRSQIGGLKVAQRNAQDAISLVQTAEGAQTEVHSILQRMRDLTVQSGNLGTNDEAALKANNDEIGELTKELDRIAGQTQFGTKLILNGSRSEFTNAAGAAADDSLGDTDYAGGTEAAFRNAVATAFSTELGVTAGDGTEVTDSMLRGITVTSTTGEDSTSTLYDLAYAANGSFQGMQLAAGDIIDVPSGGNASFDFQVGANAGQQVNIQVAGVSAAGLGVAGIDVTDPSLTDIDDALDAIDNAIETVSSNRATLGAFQNRMESTIRNVGVAVENLSAAESRIRDTDMAQEMVNFTRSQILSQAGTAMLAQANQVPQGVLSLLR